MIKQSLLCLFVVGFNSVFANCPSETNTWITDCDGQAANYAVQLLSCIDLGPQFRMAAGYPQDVAGPYAVVAQGHAMNWFANPCCCKKEQQCAPREMVTTELSYSEESGCSGSVSVTGSLSGSIRVEVGVGLTGSVGGEVTTSISETGTGSWSTITSTNIKQNVYAKSCEDNWLKILKRTHTVTARTQQYHVNRCYYGIIVEDCQDPGHPYQVPLEACDTEEPDDIVGSAVNYYPEYTSDAGSTPHTCN